MRWFFLLAAWMAWALTAYAADATGTWKGSIKTIVGDAECIINLKTDGEKISGTIKMDVFDAEIENGKLNADKVSFVVRMDFGTLIYEGTLSGDELNFIVSAPDGSYAPMNCKRQKQTDHAPTAPPMAHGNLMKRQSQRSGSESKSAVDPFEFRFRIPTPMAVVLGYFQKQTDPGR
jgi:hypothetical protein